MARGGETAADHRVLSPSTQISDNFVGVNFYLHWQRDVVLAL